MARKKSNLFETLKQQSYRTWDMLRKARMADIKLGEETLTDLNLLEMKYRHSKEIITFKFTKQQEGKEGADWEWWLTDATGKWLGFRIQAKVVDSQSNSYQHLHYKKNGVYQSDRLINEASRDGVVRIPLYCLYTNWEAGGIQAPMPCGALRKYSRSYGCSLVSAFTVRKLKNKNKSNIKDLLDHMIPWYCIFSRGTRYKSLPRRALENWRKLIWRATGLDEVRIPLYHTYSSLDPIVEPPKYVESLLEKGVVEEIDDENLQYITIFREIGE